jgi:hypothetical protein
VRIPSGLTRNYFPQPSGDKTSNQKPTINNFLNIIASIPESNKKAKEIIFQGNL